MQESQISEPTCKPEPSGFDGSYWSKETSKHNSTYLNAVYYPSWRIYKGQAPSSFSLGRVSHVFYAFAGVNPDGTVKLGDEWADEQVPIDGTRGCIRAFVQLKNQYSHLKTILSIGGGGSGSQHFAAVAGNSKAVKNFVQSAKSLVNRFSLDGLDIDWEHPSSTQEGVDYVQLLRVLREAFPSPRYTLATALPAGEWALRNIHLFHAQIYVDLFNIMAYDFSGPWTSHSGHQAQLFSPINPETEAATNSGESGVSFMLAGKVPGSKILLGIPAYGRAFPGTKGAGQVHRIARDTNEDKVVVDYRDLPVAGSIEQQDDGLCAAYCIDGDLGFISYDSVQTIRKKADFVKELGLGGLFYWHIAADAVGERSLVDAGYRALHGL